MRYPIFIFALLIICMAQASAQVYKCKDKKGGTVYSDTACESKDGKILIDIPKLPTSSILSASSFTKNESSLSRQLDTAIRRSIASNELDHAENLAITPQHWEWIATAKKIAKQDLFLEERRPT